MDQPPSVPTSQPADSTPPVPPTAPAAVPPAVPATNAVVSGNDKIFVALSHLGFFVFGVILPLIVYLAKKDESVFVGEQAKEALNFQITIFIAAVVSGLLYIVLIGIVLLPLVILGGAILSIIATIKALDGYSYRYPFCLRLVK